MNTRTLFSLLSLLAYLSKGFMREFYYAETLSKIFDSFIMGQKRQDDLHVLLSIPAASRVRGSRGQLD